MADFEEIDRNEDAAGERTGPARRRAQGSGSPGAKEAAGGDAPRPLPKPEPDYEDGFDVAKREAASELRRVHQEHADELRTLSARFARYYFTIESSLTALRVKRSDANGPRGTRIHVSYGKSGGVKTTPEKYEYSWGVALQQDPNRPDKLEYDRERDWNGISGGVLSGADFLLARRDGVLELDGRVTIRAKDDTLIDATYWGLVDLERDWLKPRINFERAAPVEAPKESALQEAATSPAYLAFIQGQLGGELRVRLCLRFETNTGPWASSAEAEDTTWTKKAREKHGKNVWKYRELVRQQFYGVGTIRFERDPDGLTTPREIKLDVVAPAFDARQP